MLISKFEIDRDQLREELEREADDKLLKDDLVTYKEYEEVYQTLEVISEIKEDMINIFDACLVQKPLRKDLIELFMDTWHTKLCERLTHEWNQKALYMSIVDIFSLLEWVHEYLTS